MINSPFSKTDTETFEAAAARIVAAASADDVQIWATEWVCEKLRDDARREALEVERAAQAASWARSAAARARERERPYTPTDDFDALLRRYGRTGYGGNPLQRVRRKLRGADADFEADRWESLTTEEKKMVIAAEPHHRGIDHESAEWAEYVASPSSQGHLNVARIEKKRREQREQREQLIARIRHETLVEWTSELLNTEFALADGSRLTWGNATLEQHESRITMLQANAVANIEALNRHYAAVMAIIENGTRSLSEIRQNA